MSVLCFSVSPDSEPMLSAVQRVGKETQAVPMLGLSRLSVASWLTACCLLTGQAGWGAPMCGQLQLGHSLVGVFVTGRWRVSLGPINSSLTEHFRVRSHALLASCTEHHPGGSTVWHCLANRKLFPHDLWRKPFFWGGGAKISSSISFKFNCRRA